MNQFDFVIIGAGSAGCALAASLAGNPEWNILLLEAGPTHDNFFVTMPMGLATLNGSARDWSYMPEATSLMPHPSPWTRGRMLGGSSSINGMVYVRGQPEDFDSWAALGNVGWSWRDVLPIYRAMENHELGADDQRGVDGPVDVTCSHEPNALSDAYIVAAAAVGIPAKPDLNREDQVGVGYFQRTIKNGRRISAAAAFLDRCKGRKNLTVITGALAQKLVFSGRRVTGVECTHEGTLRTFMAAKEVIVSGGAINSPQLLQLSGIGPAARLAQLGIPVQHNLPGVGSNLQEHWNAGTVHSVSHGSLNRELRGARLLGNVLKYAFTRRGVMAMAAAQVGGFAKTRPELTRANMQIHMAPLRLQVPDAESKGKLTLSAIGGFTATGCVLRPAPNGDVLIQSPDPRVAPRIRYEHLSTQADQQSMVDIMRLMKKIGEQPALKAFGAEEIRPGPAVQSDEALLDHALTFGNLGYHPVGTCKMGSDASAVVDARLRVHGLSGLRIADASIMPIITSGNTNAPSMMIGLKAGQMIVDDYRP